MSVLFDLIGHVGIDNMWICYFKCCLRRSNALFVCFIGFVMFNDVLFDHL